MTHVSDMFIYIQWEVYVKQTTDLWNIPQQHASSMELHKMPNRGQRLLYLLVILVMQYLLTKSYFKKNMLDFWKYTLVRLIQFNCIIYEIWIL